MAIAEALADLVTGELPLEPAGATWFIGFPSGMTSHPYRGRFVAIPDHLLGPIPPPGARGRKLMVHDLTLTDGSVVRALLLRRTEGRLGVITEADPPFESAAIEWIDSYPWDEAPSRPH